MKYAHLAALGLTLLAACGQKAVPAAAAPAPPPATGSAMAPAAPSAAMPGMTSASTAAAKIGDSTGEITALDPGASSVTLKHEPIPGVGWPAMTMTFKAVPPATLTGLKVGDKVTFSVRIESDKNLVTAISKN